MCFKRVGLLRGLCDIRGCNGSFLWGDRLSGRNGVLPPGQSHRNGSGLRPQLNFRLPRSISNRYHSAPTSVINMPKAFSGVILVPNLGERLAVRSEVESPIFVLGRVMIDASTRSGLRMERTIECTTVDVWTRMMMEATLKIHTSGHGAH